MNARGTVMKNLTLLSSTDLCSYFLCLMISGQQKACRKFASRYPTYASENGTGLLEHSLDSRSTVLKIPVLFISFWSRKRQERIKLA